MEKWFRGYTIFSEERKKRVETEQQYVRLSGSIMGFFRSGVTTVCLNNSDTAPLDKEWLLMPLITGILKALMQEMSQTQVKRAGFLQRVYNDLPFKIEHKTFKAPVPHCYLK